MNKETFMAIIADIRIAKITSFSINYKEYDILDEPIMTIKYGDINEKK